MAHQKHKGVIFISLVIHPSKTGILKKSSRPRKMASLISAAFTGAPLVKCKEVNRAPAKLGRGGWMAVECSSRPKKKGTAHQMKTRPKKTQPWDVKRKGPTFYPPLPALPPDWTLATSDDGEKDKVKASVVEVSPSLDSAVTP